MEGIGNCLYLAIPHQTSLAQPDPFCAAAYQLEIISAELQTLIISNRQVAVQKGSGTQDYTRQGLLAWRRICTTVMSLGSELHAKVPCRTTSRRNYYA